MEVVWVWVFWYVSVLVSLAIYLFLGVEIGDYFEQRLNSHKLGFSQIEIFHLTILACFLLAIIPITNLLLAWKMVNYFFVVNKDC